MANVTCPVCSGNGGKDKQCGTCLGKGCNICGKSGTVWETCSRCNGHGTVKE